MADAEHSTLPSVSVHEPKHITSGVIGDSGKVITSSSSSNSTSEYRLLDASEITAVIDYVNVAMTDIGTAKSVWVVAPNAGSVVSFSSVIGGALTGSDETITMEIATVAVTNGVITVTQSGSAAGDVDTVAPTAANTVATAQSIEIMTAGNSTGAANAVFTIGIQRSSP